MTQEAGVPRDLWGKIQKRIDESVAKLARSGMLRNASITDGNLTVKGGSFRAQYPENLGGGNSVYIGDIYGGGGYAGTGMLVQAPDGTDMILARQDAQFGNTRVDLYDSGNRVIVGNDASSGMGLARPYLPSTFYRKRYQDMTISTTSATFETLFEAQIHKQHPRYEVGCRATMDTSGTTGEVQVLINGVALGSTQAQSFLIKPNVFGPANVAGSHMSTLTVEIQGRVTSGSGALRVEPQYLIGRQSP